MYILEKSNNEVKNTETSGHIIHIKGMQIGNKIL